MRDEGKVRYISDQKLSIFIRHWKGQLLFLSESAIKIKIVYSIKKNVVIIEQLYKNGNIWNSALKVSKISAVAPSSLSLTHPSSAAQLCLGYVKHLITLQQQQTQAEEGGGFCPKAVRESVR